MTMAMIPMKLPFIESLLCARHYSKILRYQLMKSSKKNYNEVLTVTPSDKRKTEAG